MTIYYITPKGVKGRLKVVLEKSADAIYAIGRKNQIIEVRG